VSCHVGHTGTQLITKVNTERSKSACLQKNIAKRLKKKQEGAPTVSSAVNTRSIEFEDIWCHSRGKVIHSFTVCHIYIIPQLAYFYIFLLSVILVTNIIATCHWSSNRGIIVQTQKLQYNLWRGGRGRRGKK
jgi:hypothetical protein